MAVLRLLSTSRIREARIRCRIQSMVPEKTGDGVLCGGQYRSLRAVFDYYQEELDEEALEIPGQSRRNHCPYETQNGLDAKTCLSDGPLNSSGMSSLTHRAGYKASL